jgi:hypothetical protein
MPLAVVEKKKEERRKEISEQVKAKYTPQQEFKLHETKSTVEKVRAEVEAARNAELKFEGIKAKPVRVVYAPLVPLALTALPPLNSALQSAHCGAVL